MDQSDGSMDESYKLGLPVDWFSEAPSAPVQILLLSKSSVYRSRCGRGQSAWQTKKPSERQRPGIRHLNS
jgi:hypothetical protein